MKKKTLEIKKPVVKIMAKYIMPTSYNGFKWISVYSDYTILIGSEQKLETAGIQRLYHVELP